jgi:hypothetical protein
MHATHPVDFDVKHPLRRLDLAGVALTAGGPAVQRAAGDDRVPS